MTMRPTASPPFTVGSPAVVGTTWWGPTYALVSTVAPAPRAGIVTSISVYGHQAGNVYLMTGSMSGTTFTISAATGPLAVGVGANTFSVSLSIPSGGFVGCVCPSGGGGVDAIAGTGTNAYALFGAAVPAAGGTYVGMTAYTTPLSLEGTGS